MSRKNGIVICLAALLFLLPLFNTTMSNSIRLIAAEHLLTGENVEGGKIFPGKVMPEKIEARRIHPAQEIFDSRIRREDNSRAANFNRLLVLLVDFQEDNDPNTTGNGKFLLDFDPDYPVSIGAPPHDYEYFRLNLEAMRYYYLAASLGSYNIDYEIYPMPTNDSFAFTLPQKMSYYNPGMNDIDLFVQRAEEYFYDVFTVADSYGEIDFGSYAHYLIIHAGSDWQHDVAGDSPSDLPSFFINVGEGKEVWVNDGTVMISHACNVPETISQDGNYGVINAVFAHEFGHSLGFVDLYNVRNFSPGVGYWDIMDSGGAGKLVLQGNDGDLYALEGGLPALPGAWHRLLVWEEYFTDIGAYKHINDLKISGLNELSASSLLFDFDNPLPYIVKVPLNEKEFVLLENRHVDPDGDGGIAFKGAHPLTPGQTDYRVLLYPTAIEDDFAAPIYEYDWLLPGWINRFGESFGGGIIAWHIDEKIIFDEGVYYGSEFVSNYQNNSVNTNYKRRGIKIIEADNIQDIGNVNSWYWYGTEYESFFRYLPILNEGGYFTGWSYEEHNNELSALTKPALQTNDGYPSMYRIYDISASAGIMSFRYDYLPFEMTRIMSSDLDVKAMAMPGPTSFANSTVSLPVFDETGIRFFTHFYDSQYQLDYWEDLFGVNELSGDIKHSMISYHNDKANYFVILDKKLSIITEQGLSIDITEIPFDEMIVETPLVVPLVDIAQNSRKFSSTKSKVRNNFMRNSYSSLAETLRNDDVLIFVATAAGIEIVSQSLQDKVGLIPYPNARIAFDGEVLYILSEGTLYLKTIELPEGVVTINDVSDFVIPDYSSSFSPVVLKNSQYQKLFIQNNKGDIYTYENDKLKLFFTLSQYVENQLPTQLAFSQVNDKVFIVFGAGNYIFSIDIMGNLAPNYPRYNENFDTLPLSYPKVVRLNGNPCYMFTTVAEDGYLVYDNGILPEFSFVWNSKKVGDILFWDEITKRLYFFFTDGEKRLFESHILTSNNNPIIWSGERNMLWNIYSGEHQISQSNIQELTAYVFPNPVQKNEARIRVEGAKDSIELKIYDISGRNIHSEVFSDGIGDQYEIIWDTKKLSSGVYFGQVQTNGKRVIFKVGVEK